MKIGMITPWNRCCGVSLHAELIGREFIKMGHELEIFAYKKYRRWEEQYKQDEPYVNRIIYLDTLEDFRYINELKSHIDFNCFLDKKFNLLLIENLLDIPKLPLLKVLPKIKKQTKILQVIHEGTLPLSPLWYKVSKYANALICFDRRYEKLLSRFFPTSKIHVIPYPCYPGTLGNKRIAREKLNLPQDKKIIFLFGWRISKEAKNYIELLSVLKQIKTKYDFLILLLTSKEIPQKLTSNTFDLNLEIRREVLTPEDIYCYLHAADIVLIYRTPESSKEIVVSSMAHLILGSGCIILASDNQFFYTFRHDEVIKFIDFKDLKIKICQIFNNSLDLNKIRNNAIKYAHRHTPDIIASKFLEIYYNLPKQKEDLFCNKLKYIHLSCELLNLKLLIVLWKRIKLLLVKPIYIMFLARSLFKYTLIWIRKET